ncbi:reverse transcriptase domain-containing protein [Tanacetum coccineum]|uniref:Reverse transcriptase domain-containing protein n=1 Tax=Tanacetum coccineum TaxID=301880 RepID=A0ABQ4ZAV8_9ASTR
MSVVELHMAAATNRLRSIEQTMALIATMIEEIMRDPDREVRYSIPDSWLDDEPVRDTIGCDLARGEVMSLCTTVLGQMSEIRELHAADRRRQAMILEMLKADQKRSTEMRERIDGKRLQGQLHAPAKDIAGPLEFLCIARAAEDRVAVHRLRSLLWLDTKSGTIAERHAEKKRKFKNTSRNNQNQQQQNKRQNTGRAYTVGTGEKKPYGGSKPLCAKCNYHHDGPCAPKCHKCNKVGHFARDYRSAGNANNANNQRGTGSGKKPTCFECGVQGHYKRECPKLKNNKNHGNQVGNDRAPAKVYAVGHARTNPDSNVVTGTFLLNNRYASILFNTGADRSFVSTAFSSQMDITPSYHPPLDHYYAVELAWTEGIKWVKYSP